MVVLCIGGERLRVKASRFLQMDPNLRWNNDLSGMGFFGRDGLGVAASGAFGRVGFYVQCGKGKEI